MPYKRWFAFLIFILSLTVCLAGVMYQPVARRRANLASCREIGVDPYWKSTNYGVFNLDSPDGRYVVAANKAGSRGCHSIVVYACLSQQASSSIGCEGIFPPESTDVVIPQQWLSEDELAITRQGTPQVIHVEDLFEPEMSYNPDYKPPLANFQAWSPDGNWLIFSGAVQSGYDLFRMTADGSLTENLTRSGEQNHFISWTAEGDMLFNSYRDGMLELYRLDWETLEFQRLTFSIAQETWLGWESDQTHALIIANWSLVRLNTQTLAQTRLDLAISNIDLLGLTADSRYLLLNIGQTSSSGENQRVFHWWEIATQTQTPLVPFNTYYWFESWSGDRESFLGWHFGKESERIFEIFSLDGSQEEVFRASDLPEFQTWSPDGRWLIFYGYDTVSQQSYFSRVDRQNPHPPQPYTQFPMKNLYWSPDSQWLFYQDEENLYRMHPENLTTETIMVLPNGFVLQTISPDSQWLYYSVFNQTDPTIQGYRMRLDGSDLQPLNQR